MKEKEEAVIQYGLSLLKAVREGSQSPSPPKWSAYENVFGERAQSSGLCSILSLVQLEGRAEAKEIILQPQKLTADAINSTPQQAADVFGGFFEEWEKKAKQQSRRFHIFHHLFRKYAWSLPAHAGGQASHSSSNGKP